MLTHTATIADGCQSRKRRKKQRTRVAKGGAAADRGESHGFGYGIRASNDGYDALMWTLPIPGPGSCSVLGIGALLTVRRRRR
jgi:hypothetical protein